MEPSSLRGDKRRAAARRRYARNPQEHMVRTRKSQLKRFYGISWESYQEMVRKQNGRCGICDQLETAVDPVRGRIRTLAIDHDHTTGLIRGLICNRCNRVLGLFQDNASVIESALNYLRHHKEENCPTVASV